MNRPENPVAVLGASGYIGQHFARLLADHPWFPAPRLCAGPRGSGVRFAEVWQLPGDPPVPLADAVIEGTSAGRLARQGVRVVFSALPSGVAGPVESELVRRGVHVFSNAADHRLAPGVPLLVPEVNREQLALAPSRHGRGLLVTNPNCTATGLTLALAPVIALLRPTAVHVATYQALSGAGIPGVASLSAMANVIPFIEGEEEKVERESRRLLGRTTRFGVEDLELPFVSQCARVGVRDGHLEAVTVVARSRPTRASLLRSWGSFDPLSELELPTAPHPPIAVRHEPDRPQPIRDVWSGTPDRAAGMAVVVGRIRWRPPFLRFFALSHNAVRGGAGGSVLNAELAASTGRLPGFGPNGRP